MITINEFTKKHDYLICVDSDGCAMDTMNIKHFRCFGPCMVDEWELGQWREEILTRWNEINLYTMTRGVNRFRGLAKALSEISTRYIPIEDVEHLVRWVDNAKELSNASLEREIKKNPRSLCLPKALAWSIAVNKAITELPEDDVKPFPLAREALEFAHERADVAIVSSANLGAVLEEWTKHGLLPHTDIVMAQDSGTKAACIESLIAKGYKLENVLMCGDAPGDLAAARKTDVFFYPILVNHERESWQEFINVAVNKLVSGKYAGDYSKDKVDAFIKNLRD